MNSDTIRITREFRFEMAHVLSRHRGLCRNIHGHSYKLAVTVKGKISGTGETDNPSEGMVIDFSELSELGHQLVIQPYDHALVMHRDVRDRYLAVSAAGDYKVVLHDFEPTCENMLLHFVEGFKRALPGHIQLCRVMLRETENSFGEWLAEDNPS